MGRWLVFNKTNIFGLIKFLTECQIRKFVQLCCMSSSTFLQFFHSFMLIWPFQEKFHFMLYLQSCKQYTVHVYSIRYKNYVICINLVKTILTYFRNRFVPIDIFCFYLGFCFLVFLQLSTNTALKRK